VDIEIITVTVMVMVLDLIVAVFLDVSHLYHNTSNTSNMEKDGPPSLVSVSELYTQTHTANIGAAQGKPFNTQYYIYQSPHAYQNTNLFNFWS